MKFTVQQLKFAYSKSIDHLNMLSHYNNHYSPAKLTPRFLLLVMPTLLSLPALPCPCRLCTVGHKTSPTRYNQMGETGR